MSQPDLESFEKRIAALEGQVFSLRSELERAKRQQVNTPTVTAQKAEAPAVAAKATPAAAKSPAPVASIPVAPAPQQTEAGFS
ncbi:MAG: hypothetical protein J0L53_15655, partial [Spirochaetes bacterium]|nr:hypothetical protein [Spirochaetota bacterium]